MLTSGCMLCSFRSLRLYDQCLPVPNNADGLALQTLGTSSASSEPWASRLSTLCAPSLFHSLLALDVI